MNRIIASSKTVVGDAIHIGDTIVLPLIDVSFGVGASALTAIKRKKRAGGLGGQDDSVCGSCYPERGKTKL